MFLKKVFFEGNIVEIKCCLKSFKEELLGIVVVYFRKLRYILKKKEVFSWFFFYVVSNGVFGRNGIE